MVLWEFFILQREMALNVTDKNSTPKLFVVFPLPYDMFDFI